MSDDRRPIILCVDDEPENLDLLERTLGFDYRVLRAGSGEEALALLQSSPDVAIIITDQRMPGLTGTELLREARVRRPEAVRIILTGYTSTADLIEAINSSNVYRYLTKPWDLDELTALVGRATRLYEAGGGELVDEVTGLPNRGLVRKELDRELLRARLGNGQVLVASIRIEGLADHGRTAGAAAAEQVVVRIVDFLRMEVRPLDILGVQAPDALVLIQPHPIDERLADTLLGRLSALAAVRAAAERTPSLRITTRTVRGAPGTSSRDLLESAL